MNIFVVKKSHCDGLLLWSPTAFATRLIASLGLRFVGRGARLCGVGLHVARWSICAGQHVAVVMWIYCCCAQLVLTTVLLQAQMQLATVQ